MVYPLSIIQDRYNGAYSGFQFTAWNHSYDNIPPEVNGSDSECFEFWEGGGQDKYMIGGGNTTDEAVQNLEYNLSSYILICKRMPKQWVYTKKYYINPKKYF